MNVGAKYTIGFFVATRIWKWTPIPEPSVLPTLAHAQTHCQPPSSYKLGLPFRLPWLAVLAMALEPYPVASVMLLDEAKGNVTARAAFVGFDHTPCVTKPPVPVPSVPPWLMVNVVLVGVEATVKFPLKGIVPVEVCTPYIITRSFVAN